MGAVLEQDDRAGVGAQADATVGPAAAGLGEVAQEEAGKGDAGDLAPAAKIKLDERGAFVIEDYGAGAVRLTGIARK